MRICWLLIALSMPALADGLQNIPQRNFELIARMPRDASLFTQGLLIHDGLLYHSGGYYGESRLVISEPGSSRFATLRRGSILPRDSCRARDLSPPPIRAASAAAEISASASRCAARFCRKPSDEGKAEDRSFILCTLLENLERGFR